jgi:hypothetical protein
MYIAKHRDKQDVSAPRGFAFDSLSASASPSVLY